MVVTATEVSPTIKILLCYKKLFIHMVQKYNRIEKNRRILKNPFKMVAI